MSWIYKKKKVTEETIAGYYGFVYCITNQETGKKYIGRKYFTKAKRYQVKNKKKTKRVSSDWEEYYGSNKQLLEDVEKLGRDKFKREILHLSKKRAETNYLETKEIISRDCLLKEDYYNNWVSCKITRNHLR